MSEIPIKEELEGKRILVTGGTGSFGHQITEELIKYNPSEVILFSNDENQQYNMENEFKDNELLRFALGDVRSFSRSLEITKRIDIVYHAAALKHVPMCERHPFDAVETNIIGAYNVKMASILNNVKKVIAISTDKAVKPVNFMGMSKAIQ